MICRAAVSLGAIAALLANPAAAQDAAAASQLEDLIPDEAVDDPEGWAQRGVPAEAVAAQDAEYPVDPDALLAEDSLAEIGDSDIGQFEIAWPDQSELPLPDTLEADEEIEFATFDEDAQFAIEEGEERRISDELMLVFPAEAAAFPERGAFVERFESLSSVDELDDDGSPARLAAQARVDERLLQRMLRNYGYYDAQVLRSHGGPSAEAEPSPDEPGVRFDILPGAQYRFGVIDLGNLAATGMDYPMLREAFAIQTGDPVNSDTIALERSDLDLALGENGYPFASIQPPELLIDHARQEGDLAMPVTAGGKYVIGKITSTMPGFMSDRHLDRIARFEPGDTYQRSLQTDLRRAILATGLVASVDVTPVEAVPPAEGQPGTVDIQVAMTEAKLRTIAGGIGYGTGEGFKAQASWEHRNLFPSEGMLRLRGIAGTQEQFLGATFRKNNFRGRDRILTIDTFASTIDYEAYDARTLSLVGTYERVSNLLFQKPFSWGLGVELVATEQAERKERDTISPDQKFLIAALPAHGQIDTSDNLLDPTTGFRLRGAISPELSRTAWQNSTYVKVQFDLAKYQQVRDNIVLAARARAGSIVGAPITNIAPSRRYYAGGGGSVRGYGYQEIGPRDEVGVPNGGRSLFEVSVEARIRTGLMDGAIGIVPFLDAGTVDRGSVPDFSDVRLGAGIGLRYFTDFGPVRVDVGVPLNPETGDGPVGVYVALGQAF